MFSAIASPRSGGSFSLLPAFGGELSGCTTALVPAAFRKTKVCRARALRHPSGPTPWMMTRSKSVFSAFTDFPLTGSSAAFVPGIGTSCGSSNVQFATSLLISASDCSFGFVITAISCEPSPLKSPMTNVGVRDSSIFAKLSKTRESADATSPVLGVADEALAGAGEGANCASGVNEGAAGLLLTATGCNSELAFDFEELAHAVRVRSGVSAANNIAFDTLDLFDKTRGREARKIFMCVD